MEGKLDLAKMLREISEEQAARSAANRPLSQEEIKRMVEAKADKQAGARQDGSREGRT